MGEWIHSTVYAIGGLTIIVGFFFALILWMERQHDKIEYFRKLLMASHLDHDFEIFWSNHSNYSYEQALCKFFTPEKETLAMRKKEEIEIEKEEIEKLLEKEEDKQHKEIILNRVFAYDFEKFIFNLYAPLAINEHGKWMLKEASLPYDDVYEKFLEHYAGTSKGNKNTFEELISRRLLDKSYQNPTDLKVGIILTLYANVISKADLNIEIWMTTYAN